MSDIFLDDLEMRFEQQQKLKALSNKKYSRLSHVLDIKSKEFEEKMLSAPGNRFKMKSTDEDEGSSVVLGAPVLGQDATKAIASAKSGRKKFLGFMDGDGNTEGFERGFGQEDEENMDNIDKTEDIDFEGNRSDDDNEAEKETALQQDNGDEEFGKKGSGYADVMADSDESDNEFEDSDESDVGGKDFDSDKKLSALSNIQKEFPELHKRKADRSMEDSDSERQANGDEMDHKRLKPSDDSGSSLDVTAHSSTQVIPASGNYITELNLRRYLQEKNGWSAGKDIIRFFKKPLSENPDIAKKKLKEVIESVAIKQEHSTRGQIYVLRSS